MKVLFITNIPSPYRVDFFNELGKHCDLTVCYERKSAGDRDTRWRSDDAIVYKDTACEEVVNLYGGVAVEQNAEVVKHEIVKIISNV